MSSPSSRKRAQLDPATKRLSGGRLLLGGEPPRLVRLSPAGASALDRLLAGGEGPSGPAEERLFARLFAAGLLHESPPSEAGRLEVSFVVPVRQPAPGLGELLLQLTSSRLGPVVVVDDGSPDGGAETAALAEKTGARLVRRARNGGPAAARNSAGVEAEIVVYLDADTVLARDEPLGWLGACLSHFCDSGLALVAPRVRSLGGPGALARYEEAHSPIDLGPHPGLVGAFRRLSYLPATALVVRRQALEEVGGFDEELRYGEDVDLVRRLVAKGWRVRYEPAGVVFHRPRRLLGDFCRQRFSYGTAAAPLHRRHRGTLPPYAASPAAAATSVGLLGGAGLLFSGRPRAGISSALLGALVGLGWLVRLGSKLEGAAVPSPYRVAAELVGPASVSSMSALLRAIRRGWWPFFLLLALLLPPRRRALLSLFLALVGSRAAETRGLAAGELPAALALGLLDDLSYGTGVLVGCLREGSAGALSPRLVRSRPTDR